jgi:hypothetical protein
MRDYEELVKALRCCSKIDARNNGCDSCPYEYCGDDCQNLCGCAADAIEELLAELVTLRNQLPTWISVEDNSLDTDSRVVGYFGGGDYDQLRWYDFVTTLSDGSVVPSSNGYEISNAHCIALFQLPEPPKGVE